MFVSFEARPVSRSIISMQHISMILSRNVLILLLEGPVLWWLQGYNWSAFTVIRSRKLAVPASLANILKTVDNILIFE